MTWFSYWHYSSYCFVISGVISLWVQLFLKSLRISIILWVIVNRSVSLRNIWLSNRIWDVDLTHISIIDFLRSTRRVTLYFKFDDHLTSILNFCAESEEKDSSTWHNSMNRISFSKWPYYSDLTNIKKVFETWHTIVKRYDQSTISDENSAYVALISNLTKKHRKKDMDLLRTFINDMKISENRFDLMINSLRKNL